MNHRPLLVVLWLAAVVCPIVMVVWWPQYFLNYYALGSLIASYFIGILGIAIAGKRFEREERRSLFVLSLCFFFWLWTAGIGGLCRPDQANLANLWFKIGNLAIVIIATQTYVFTTKFLNIRRPLAIAVGYSLTTIFAFMDLGTNLLVQGVHLYPWGFYPRWHMPYCIPFFAYFGVFLTMSLIEYIRAKQRSENQRMRNQINYLLFAFSISYLGSIDYLPALGFDVYPLGFIAVMGWWSILAIAILKHRLLDITIILRKTIVYSVVTGALTAVYLSTVALFAHVFEGFTGAQTVFSSTVAAGLITICFQPLRKRVQAFVDKKFFRQYVDREEKLYELSREVITHTTPEAMAEALIRVLGDTLHPKSGALYLKSRDGSGYSPVASWGDVPSDRLLEDNPLARYFADHPQPFVQDYSTDLAQSYNTREKTERGEAA